MQIIYELDRLLANPRIFYAIANQFEGPETEGSLASAEAIPATDLEAITSARESAYEVKFSTELMLPLRRLKAAKAAAWEPGVLVEGQDDDELRKRHQSARRVGQRDPRVAHRQSVSEPRCRGSHHESRWQRIERAQRDLLDGLS